jgi:hypothetical protein
MSPKKRGSTFTVRLVVAMGMWAPADLAQDVGSAPTTSATLGKLTRVCVDQFSGDTALVSPVREIAIAALFGMKRFVVTENCAKADATMRGAVIERTGRRARSEGEAADFGAAAGGASVSRSGGAAGFGAIIGGSSEALASSETTAHASVTLRLVDSDGDVIWAHTQDSQGGKTKGAIADAVERAIRQLGRDVGRSAAR